jgi:mannose-1-phosphate guanylyltransferase / mannose-6-phosphate isomerase
MIEFVQPVILCGGSGTRLWPLSRAGFPKQFLCLTGTESLFQQAARRLMGIAADNIRVARPLIVTGEEHRFLATEQLREVGIEMSAALLEPVGRNTAPALTLAALAAWSDGQDPVMVVTPADQTVANVAVFTQAMQQAVGAAANGGIVILGIPPDAPETGYGYIQVNGAASQRVANVRRFVEKPGAATARQYLAEGVRLAESTRAVPAGHPASHHAGVGKTQYGRESRHAIRSPRQGRIHCDTVRIH